MATARLRVFPHPDEEQEDPRIRQSRSGSVSCIRSWPRRTKTITCGSRDFEDDELMVSNDLYEVSCVFQLSSFGVSGWVGLVRGGRKFYCKKGLAVSIPHAKILTEVLEFA